MYLDYVQRQRCFIFVHDITYNIAASSITPLYDSHHIKFMLSVPPAALQNQLAYRTLLSNYFKPLARIINANDDRPILVDRKGVVNLFKYLALKIPLSRFIEKATRLKGRGLTGISKSMWDFVSFPQYKVMVKHSQDLLCQANL